MTLQDFTQDWNEKVSQASIQRKRKLDSKTTLREGHQIDGLGVLRSSIELHQLENAGAPDFFAEHQDDKKVQDDYVKVLRGSKDGLDSLTSILSKGDIEIYRKVRVFGSRIIGMLSIDLEVLSHQCREVLQMTI